MSRGDSRDSRYHAVAVAAAEFFAAGAGGRARWATAAVLAIAALSGACGRAETVAEPPAQLEPPPLVLSLSRDVSELLVELGVGASVVGADSASLAVPGLVNAVDLGLGGEHAADLANALRVDLAIGLGDATGQALAAALEQRGVSTVLLAPRSSNEVMEALQRLGAIVHREKRAAIIAARITREVSEINTRRDGRPRLVAAWLLEQDPPVVVGGTGLLHELLELAGADNAFHGPQGERIRVTSAELAASAADLWLDSTGAPRGAASLVVPSGVPLTVVPPELARLPALDLVSRVRRLHALLYP